MDENYRLVRREDLAGEASMPVSDSEATELRPMNRAQRRAWAKAHRREFTAPTPKQPAEE